MIQLNFLNVEAHDNGNGLEINGQKLEHIISAALKTIKKVPDKYDWLREAYKNKGHEFSSNLCNISVTIDDRSKEIGGTITFSENSDGKEEYEEKPFDQYLKGLENEYAEEAEPGSEEGEE